MAVIGINYNEGNKKDLGYKSVDISYDGLKKKKVFNTGNFVKDWYDMIKFMITKLSEKEDFFVCSSSVDHFRMDGSQKFYDPAWLVTNDKPKLVYTHPMLDPDGEESGIKFYVEKGTQPTWEELKEKYDEKGSKKSGRSTVLARTTRKIRKTTKRTKVASSRKTKSSAVKKNSKRVARKVRKK